MKTVKEILSTPPASETTPVLPVILIGLATVPFGIINIILFGIAKLCQALYLFQPYVWLIARTMEVAGKDSIGTKLRLAIQDRAIAGTLRVGLECPACSLDLHPPGTRKHLFEEEHDHVGRLPPGVV